MLASAGLAAIFVVFLVQSIQLPLGDELGPGPGFFPLAISIVGLLLAIVLFVGVSRTKPDVEAKPFDWFKFRTVVAVLLTVTIGTLAFEPLGYTLTSLFLVPAILLILGARSNLAIGIVSIVMSFGVFHVFYYWLNVALPVGVIGI